MAESRAADAQQAALAAAEEAAHAAAAVPAARLAGSRASARALSAAQRRVELLEGRLQEAADAAQQLQAQMARAKVQHIARLMMRCPQPSTAHDLKSECVILTFMGLT